MRRSGAELQPDPCASLLCPPTHYNRPRRTNPPPLAQDVYTYAKSTAVCPQEAYPYVSGDTGVSGTCTAACASQARIKISGTSLLQAAMKGSGYLTDWPTTSFAYSAFVWLPATTNAIADASGCCCTVLRWARKTVSSYANLHSLPNGPSTPCSQFIAKHNPVSFDFTVYTDFFSCG